MGSQDPDDCFHMISQLPWEEEVIWDGQDEAKMRIMTKIGRKCHAAGWIPSAMHRCASDFNIQVRNTTAATTPKPQNQQQNNHTSGRSGAKNKTQLEDQDPTWYSIFPVENEDLVYGTWENNIIWDADNLHPDDLQKNLLTLDPNDDNIIFQIPEDVPSNRDHQLSIGTGRKGAASQQSQKDKKDNVKKSKIILGKAGVIVEPEVISPPPEDVHNEKLAWNVSNDEYYTYKATPDAALKPTISNLIQHSTPAVELRQPFFPTFLNRDRLREFHRPPLFPSGRKSRAHSLADSKYHPIESLTKHIAQQAQAREKQRNESGGGEMFFMHTAEDCSGKDAELILAEYCEEYPPLLNQVGMATKIKNYMRRRTGLPFVDQESDLVNKYEHGEPAIVTASPFLGTLAPGQSLQTIENNMYRAPIYRHKFPSTDFLVIKSQDQYWIRDLETIYTVGQELPIIEVPGPNSKKANNFIRDFLQVYIYRMFWRSPLEPKRIKMDDIKKAFPNHSESSIRKRLKQCADFNRTGDNPNMWYLKKPGEFRLPQEAEIRTIVIPEQCCAYYSMLAAERRLQDAGYGEKSLCTLEDDDDEDKQREMEDEVKAAPWNTTRAFIAAMKQKCLLQLTGVADPTGCNEGFSYVRVPNKPLLPKEEATKEPQPKKTVTGTDADLRRLKLDHAKKMLRESGVSDVKIDTLQRWQVISLVRELSTRQVRAGEDSMSKFARGNRFSIAEHQERYKEECQRIFDLQNKVLGTDEELTSSDESDEDIEQDCEMLRRAVETKSSTALMRAQEEQDLRDLHKMVFGDEDTNGAGDSQKAPPNPVTKSSQQSSSIQTSAGVGSSSQPTSCKFDPETLDDSSNMGLTMSGDGDKILKIYRTYRDNNTGREFVREETVRRPAVINSYVKIRKTKDSDAIKEFALSLDDPQRDSKRKERKIIRRRRVNHETKSRNQSAIDLSSIGSASRRESPRTTATNSPSNFASLTGGGIGGHDSDRSPRNSISPDDSTVDSSHVVKRRREKDGSKLRCSACGGLGHMKNNRSCPAQPARIQVAMTREQFEEEQESSLCSMDIIKTEDTKIVINKKFIEKFEENRKRALKLKIPKKELKKKRTSQEDLEYLKKPERKNYRAREPRA